MAITVYTKQNLDVGYPKTDAKGYVQSISGWLLSTMQIIMCGFNHQNPYFKILGISLVKFPCDNLHIVDNQPEIDCMLRRLCYIT